MRASPGRQWKEIPERELRGRTGQSEQRGSGERNVEGCRTCPKTLDHLSKVIHLCMVCATQTKKSVKKHTHKRYHKHETQLWRKAKGWEQRNVQGQHHRKRRKEQPAQKRRKQRSPGNRNPERECEVSVTDLVEDLLKGYRKVWGK